MLLDLVWAVIGVVIIMLNFLPNRIVDTNCQYIYIGSLVIFIGVLTGLSDMPVIAGSIVFVGAVCVIWATTSKQHRRDHKRMLDKR